jgi:hypothetical protein
VLRRYDAAGALQDSPISVDPTTGAATIAHPLTTNSQVINGVGAAATRELSLNVDSGYSSSIRWRTAASLRWSLSKTSTAESGSNAGSNVSLARFDDAGALLGTPITVARNTGLMTVAEGLAVSGNGGAASGFTSLGVSSTTTTAPVNIDSIAGQFAITRYRTGVLTRWDAGKETTAEGGSNAGSDYTLRAFTDAGTLRAIALKISRANGDATFEAKGTFGGLVSGAAGFQSGSVTIGTIPSASLFPRTSIYCSDLGGGGGHISSDGTAWRRERSDSYEVRSTDAGAAFTYTHLTSAQTQRLTAGITAARTVTLTAGAPSGVRARFIRDAAATGAFNWAIGGLKNLTAGTWCEIESDGTNWFLAEYGSL